MHSAEQLRERFEASLADWLPQGNPDTLYEPIRYAVMAGGKRTRPVLLLMMGELFGLSPEQALPQAVAVEWFHTFTLVHDDIMDHAELRRGRPSVHAKYSQPTAILAGDAMLVYCFGLMSRCPSALQKELIGSFVNCALKVCEGQQLDMDFERLPAVSVKEYLYMIERKTAELLAFSAYCGALLAGAGQQDQQAAYRFGKHLGVAFQLMDDYLDTFGESQLTGKTPGGDLFRNKKTYLHAKIREQADQQTLQTLDRLMSDTDSLRENLESVKNLFRSAGVDRLLQNEIECYSEAALQELKRLSVDPSRKKELGKLTETLKRRLA
ncbi:MAG: polyprenyl synthetase family protein [Chitinophagales bacterium]|nr:polyprenyl synthetase family protein [Chitinophagales bacterium]MDW8392622.1 polyprenyl synthetase family protein [Chitinophagales bacterium]